jgi:ANTAR domain
VQWPVREAGGSARLFADGRFFTPSGRACMLPITPRQPAHAVVPAYPLVLNNGRNCDQWHDGAQGTIKAAMEAGASAYVVDGLTAEHLKPILDVACARFEAHQAMSSKLADTERELAERKTVERAKGLLMERRSLSEDKAYKELRQLAMSTGKSMREVAETLIAAQHLL